jgi:hypothetical protein
MSLQRFLTGVAIIAVLLSSGCDDTPLGSGAEDVAVRLLPSGRVEVNPAILQGLDTAQPMWVTGDYAEWLSLFEEEKPYWNLQPANRNRLVRRNDGWYESAAPVVPGECFTIAQLVPDGGHSKRAWALYGDKSGWQGVYSTGTSAALLLSASDGNPAKTWDTWIRLETEGGRRYLVIDRHILPVDDDQLAGGWVLVGDAPSFRGWVWENGDPPVRSDAATITFDVTGLHGLANVTAVRKNPVDQQNRQVWGRFGHFNGSTVPCNAPNYRHPLVYYDPSGDSGAIQLP